MQWVVEDCLCLDANKLAKNKWFRGTYQSGTMTWSSGANINLVYCRRSSTLELRYNLDGEAHPQAISVSRSACHFGGYRYYFHCPGCGSRRYKLHCAHSGFYCRGCYRLPYFSQQCGRLDGLTQQLHKAQAKLDNCSKYTRAKTFDKLIDQVVEAEQRADDEFMRLCAPLLFGKLFTEDDVKRVGGSESAGSDSRGPRG